MILGIGTDIVEIARISSVLEKREEALLKRLFTETELQQLPAKNNTAYIAKRWAAKEAIAKALGTGIGATCSFQDIEVFKTEKGQPYATLSAELCEKLPKMQNRSIRVHLSLSDETDYALAYALLEYANGDMDI